MADPTQAHAPLELPARSIPVPTTISPEAQAALAAFANAPRAPEPDPADKAAWREHIRNGEAAIAAIMQQAAEAYPCTIDKHRLAHADLYEVTPANITDDKNIILFIHGGAYVMGGGINAAYMAAGFAGQARMRAFSTDYRMPPEHPYPAGLDDTLDAYRFLLERYAPQNIAIQGSSAGGGLGASFVLKARDLGLPMPAACALATPELDLTEAGDTFETNAFIDVVLKRRLTNSVLLYAGGHDCTSPYLSAIYGDFNKGFPPTVLTTGTRDLFLSNTVRMHRALRRAGVETELHVFEAMPHGGFFGAAPENQEVNAEQIQFIRKHLAP